MRTALKARGRSFFCTCRLPGRPGASIKSIMMIPMPADPGDVEDLVKQAAFGDSGSWMELMKRVHSFWWVRRMVSFRLDPRLQGRVDPSDVVQDVCLEAWQHLGSYVSQPNTPLFLWLRAVAGHKLGDLHRHHLGTRMRDARREVSLYQGSRPGATSAALPCAVAVSTRPARAASVRESWFACRERGVTASGSTTIRD